jgi:hypothetical protein
MNNLKTKIGFIKIKIFYFVANLNLWIKKSWKNLLIK